MKRQKRIFLMIFAVLAGFFVPGASAITQKIKLTDMAIAEKSDTVTVEDIVFTDNTINSKITFGKEGDFAQFKLELQNTSEEKCKINTIADNLTSDSLKFEYSYSNDFIAPQAKTDVLVKMIYAKKVINVEKVSFDDISISLELEKENQQIETVTINPKTNDSIFQYILLFAGAAIILVATVTVNKHKKTKIAIVSLMILGAVMLPAAVMAAEQSISSVYFANIDIVGEFENYAVSFDPKNGNTQDESQIKYGEKIGDNLPADPQKNGYEFEKWVDEDGNEITADTVITEPMEFVATYHPKNYDIECVVGEGTLSTANPTSYTIETPSFKLNNPTREHYDFIGWTGSNGTTPQIEVTIPLGTTGELTYNANYSPKSYTVTFNPGDGTLAAADASRSVSYGSAVGTLPEPILENNGFLGWFTAADGGDKITAETVIEGAITYYAHYIDNSTLATNIIADEVNDLGDYQIDFSRGAKKSDVVRTNNGNGVNEYLENGQTIYYYRGEVDNNNVIWANKCWKILRTTATGGTKIVYNGVPTEVEVDGVTTYQCLAEGLDAFITDNDGDYRFQFNGGDGCASSGRCAMAYMGYMYGDNLTIPGDIRPKENVYIYSDSVSRQGDTYTLNTSSGHSISGKWADIRTQIGESYRYFCTNKSDTCNSSQIGYITDTNPRQNLTNVDYLLNYYFPIGGYDDIDDFMRAANENLHDSEIKKSIDTWYEENLIDNGDDLEDAVFCNERAMQNGALAADPNNRDANKLSRTVSYQRLNGVSVDADLKPSLDCSSVNDSFTTDPANGNGKLKYKIGMITADEATLSSVSVKNNNYKTSYLQTDIKMWTMTAFGLSSGVVPYGIAVHEYSITGQALRHSTSKLDIGIRPVVSLKAGIRFNQGDGLKTNPYIAE